MLITELIHVYEELEKAGIVRFGWNTFGDVHYGIDIDATGRIYQILPFIEGKKPRKMLIPSSTKKESSGLVDKYICGTSKYMLGYTFDNKKKAFELNEEAFEKTRNYHRKLLGTVNTPAAKAIVSYFDYYSDNLEELFETIDRENHKEYSGSVFMLCYDGKPVTEYPEIVQAWDEELPRRMNEENDCLGISMVSGELSKIARLHPGISLRGGQSKPALISFNENSFTSYGLESSANAPVSVIEAIKYTGGLNYLLETEGFHAMVGDTTVVMWTRNIDADYSSLSIDMMFGLTDENKGIDQEELNKICKDISAGKQVHFNEKLLLPDEEFFIAGFRPNGGRVQLEFFHESTFGELIRNIEAHYERLQLDDAKPQSLLPWMILQETVMDADKINKCLRRSFLLSIINNTRYPAEIYFGVLDRIRKEPQKPKNGNRKMPSKVTTRKAQVIKMYLAKNSPSSKEVITLSLNKDAKSIGYQCGRLFAVLEKIQNDASGAETLAVKHYNTAMVSPTFAFPKLLKLAQHYLSKLDKWQKVWAEKLMQEIMEHIPSFPKHLTSIEQGEFCLGYYHQKQDFFKPKNREEEVKYD